MIGVSEGGSEAREQFRNVGYGPREVCYMWLSWWQVTAHRGVERVTDSQSCSRWLRVTGEEHGARH